MRNTNGFKVFTRNWWKKNPSWPGGREPDAGARKRTLGYVETEEEAIAMCREYNTTHSPGELSRKAEWMDA